MSPDFPRFHEARRSWKIAWFFNSSMWHLTRLKKHFKQQTDRKTIEQTLVLRILVPSSKETTRSGEENVGCVGVGRSEAFVSDTQAEYTPLPPTATLHPIVGQQSQISWMKQLQWAATRDFLNQPSNSVEWLSRIHSLQHSPPHLRTRSFLFPVIASHCRLHLVSIQVLRCKGVELEASCFFQKCCRT